MTYQTLGSPMNSSGVDDILNDVDVSSWDTIVPNNRESRQPKNLPVLSDLRP